MAASIAAPIAADTIEKLVVMIGQKLASEGSLVVNFSKDFQWLTDELNLTKAYVKDAHQKSTQNDFAIKQWLSKLNDVVFDAEDILEECAAESLYQPKTNKSRALSRSWLIFKYKIGRRIRDLKARMSSIVADAKRLRLFRDLNPSEEASTSSLGAEQWKRSSLLESNAQPVAIQDKVDEIIRLLNDPAHHIIGVVGMGGVGKTFLLQNVYNNPRTKGMFEKCLWLSISQTYSLKKLQSDMASSLNDVNLRDVVAGHVSEQRAAEVIHDNLHEKKFLIVLDDVWRATEHENLIERLGVHVNTQSKIVVTTRNKEVCRVMNAYSYHMEVLKEEESWNLFRAYAFSDYPENRPPPYLEELARQVEGECGKLPLALKIVGASMANQTLVEPWESKLQKLKTLRELEDPIHSILQLSYDSLPAHLKPCFLYFGFFGEDEIIDVQYVIELWRAEGFIGEGDDARKIGLNYIYQLSNLCLIEKVEYGFQEKYCKLHDLILDLVIRICKENNCAFTLEDRCMKYSSSCTQSPFQPHKSSGCRRLFLAKQGIADDDMSGSMLICPTVRTLSLRNNDKVQNIPASSFSKVRALRVLDLSYTDISTLPSSIGRLKLLRVLNLGKKIKELPECIRSLKNLRVLRTDMAMGRPNERLTVPEWVSELACLEHLVLPSAESMPKTTSELRSLRVLDLGRMRLSVEENGLLRLEDIRNLIGLQELEISIHCEEELQRMKEGVLEPLVKMRRLCVFNGDIDSMGRLTWFRGHTGDVPVFPEKLTSMRHLEYLWLWGFIVPSASICELVNLRVLRLDSHDCSEYPAVQSLPNLISLVLRENEKCKEMRELFGKCGAFPKLRFLQIQCFRMLEEFIVLEEGSMPCLEELCLVWCRGVGRVEGLERLKSLKLFDFDGSGTDECRERLKEGGEEWKKIKTNNPRVKIDIVTRG